MEEKKRTFGKPFAKGDPRINRNGRPRNFDALRELAKEIALRKCEKPRYKELTIAEYILVRWSQSSNWYCQKAFLEIAFGKVPDKVEVEDKTQSLADFAAAMRDQDSQ